MAIGIIHLLMAFSLRLWTNIKHGNKFFILTHDIPTIIQFLAIAALILAAIGSSYDIIGMFGISGAIHKESVPWLSFLFGKWVTVDLVAKAAGPGNLCHRRDNDIRRMEGAKNGRKTWSGRGRRFYGNRNRSYPCKDCRRYFLISLVTAELVLCYLCTLRCW